MLNPTLFSSRTDEWSTPQAFFDLLSQRFYFTLDPCATPENAKCSSYFTKAEDGLVQKWSGRVFMNPPYGRQIGKWVKKAFLESQQNADLVALAIHRILPLASESSSVTDETPSGAESPFLGFASGFRPRAFHLFLGQNQRSFPISSNLTVRGLSESSPFSDAREGPNPWGRRGPYRYRQLAI